MWIPVPFWSGNDALKAVYWSRCLHIRDYSPFLSQIIRAVAALKNDSRLRPHKKIGSDFVTLDKKKCFGFVLFLRAENSMDNFLISNTLSSNCTDYSETFKLTYLLGLLAR